MVLKIIFGLLFVAYILERISIAKGFQQPTGGDTEDDFMTAVNPATGLPMIGGISGVDSSGNAFGQSSDDHRIMGLDDD